MSDIRFKKLHDDARIPSRATNDDAGYDLCSVEELKLAPGRRSLVRTGIAVEVPAGHGGLVLPRSGLALKHGITVVNGPGLIDPGYRGEVGVILLNTDTEETFEVAVGDRIAQLMIVPFADLSPAWSEDLSESERGSGGFGSTGRS